MARLRGQGRTYDDEVTGRIDGANRPAASHTAATGVEDPAEGAPAPLRPAPRPVENHGGRWRVGPPHTFKKCAASNPL